MSYAATAFDPERHRQDLVRLLAENLPVGTPSEVEGRVDWFYAQNPAGHPATAMGVHSESGEVIGCGSYYPRTLFVPMPGDGSREVRSGILCDFGVTKAHRSAGAAISIQRALARGSFDSGFSFLFGSPNDNALAIFKRLGYRHLGDSVTYVKPLRSRSFLEKRGAPSALAFAGALAGDPVLATRDLGLMLPSLLRLKGDVVRTPDGAFDDLWARARRHWVVGERSTDFLHWRYGRAQGPPFEIFRLRARVGGALTGYAVFQDKGTHAEVVDAFTEDLDNLDVLLLHLAQHLRGRGLQTLWLSFFGADRFESTFTRCGFVKRPGTRAVYAYFDPKLDPALKDALADRQRWFMLEGEIDL